MGSPDQLEILIKLLADVTGAKLTVEQIDAIKEHTRQLKQEQDEQQSNLDSKTDQVSTRMYRRSSMAIAGMLGLHGPIEGAINRFEFLKYSADAAGISVGTLLATAVPGLAAVAAASKAVEYALQLSKDTDQALTDAGLNAQGFWKNLAMGFGIKEGPKISSTIDFKELGLKEIDARVQSVLTMVEKWTHQSTPAERAAAAVKGEGDTIVDKESRMNQLSKRADAIRNALANQGPGDIYDIAKLVGVSTAGRTQPQIQEKINEALKGITDEFHALQKEIGPAKEALRKRTEDLTKQEMYAEEESKANRAELAGNEKEAAKIRAVAEQGRKEGTVPGSPRYKEIEAGIGGFSSTQEMARAKVDWDEALGLITKEIANLRRAELEAKYATTPAGLMEAQAAIAKARGALPAGVTPIGGPLEGPEGTGVIGPPRPPRAPTPTMMDAASIAAQRDAQYVADEAKRQIADAMQKISSNGADLVAIASLISAEQVRQGSQIANLKSR